MPWHPPIPFGALYTEEAIQLGPALSLLGYCYDTVGRNGWSKISLRQASVDMGVSYATVKRWWDMLQKTDYIAEYHDHRRGGMEIRIADQWLDWWRETRYEKGADVSPFTDEIDQKSSKKGPKKSAEVSHQNSAYKDVSLSGDQSIRGGSEDRDRTARNHPPAVAILFEIFPDATISVEQTDDLCSISNLALWREVLVTWRANGYKPRIGNLLDRYQKDSTKGPRNGTTRPTQHNGRHPDPRTEWAGFTETDLDKPL